MKNNVVWEPFYLKDLYYIQMGNGFDKNKLDETLPQVNLVSRISYNNGVDTKVALVDDVKPFKAGLMTVALGGSYLGSCFLQKEDFYTGQNVAVLTPKHDEMSELINIFISSLVRIESKTKYYAFGRELNTHIRTDFNISLPIVLNSDNNIFIDENKKYSTKGYIPDWNFIENYMRSLHYKKITTKNKKETNDFSCQTWKEFKIGDIFKKNKIKHFSAIPESEGKIPFISSTSTNNGVTTYVNETPISGNCISVSTNGDCFDCFYQPDNIVISNDVEVLYNKNLNKYNALFIVTILRLEKIKYSYGRKPKNDKVYETIIKLPAIFDETKKNYTPDWQYMENYIKKLPYGDKI